MSEEYTLPRVMQFLQLEWQRNERDRIQWELEKAEMKSRIVKLEGDKQQQDRQLQSAQKTIQLLKHTGELPTDPVETRGAQDMSSLVQARQYLEECVSDVRTLLEQTSASDKERIKTKKGHYGARSRLLSTLTNFSGEPTVTVGISPHLFVVGTDEGQLMLWSLDEGLLDTIQTQGKIVGLHVGDSLELFCINSASAAIYTIHNNSKIEPGELVPLAQSAVSSAYSEQLKLIAISNPEGLITIFGLDLTVERAMRVFPESLALVPTCLEFSDQLLLVGYSDGGLLLADPLSSQLVRRIYTPPAQALLSKNSPAVLSLKVSPNNTTAIAGNASGDLRVYDLTKGMLKEEVTGAHAGAVSSISFGANNIVTTSADGTVSLWAANIGTLAWYGRLLSHDTLETSGSLCSCWEHNVIVVGGADGLVRAYSMI